MTQADALEAEIMEKSLQLAALRAAEPGVEIADYSFQTLDGETTLSGLFAGRDRLLAIHNMGQACRYCTVWADGINGVLGHLEATMSVALLSKDPPETQRRLAQDRGWRFRMASHGGGPYMTEQSVTPKYGNAPGAVIYEKLGDQIIRRGTAPFGPGDLYSPLWHFLSLAGVDQGKFTPQFHYWKRPQVMEDGGAGIVD